MVPSPTRFLSFCMLFLSLSRTLPLTVVMSAGDEVPQACLQASLHSPLEDSLPGCTILGWSFSSSSPLSACTQFPSSSLLRVFLAPLWIRLFLCFFLTSFRTFSVFGSLQFEHDMPWYGFFGTYQITFIVSFEVRICGLVSVINFRKCSVFILPSIFFLHSLFVLPLVF